VSVGAAPIGHVISINVGEPRKVELVRGRIVETAIWKQPVSGRIRVRGVNLAGDGQADRSVHGGLDKAVYAYAAEDYLWWESQLGVGLAPGTFGDNLTTFGIDLNAVLVGERWRVGTALLEASQPRIPCFKLGIRMAAAEFPRLFSLAGRWGVYFRVIEEGELGAGDEIHRLSRPDHEVTAALVAETYYGDHTKAGVLLAAPQLPADWRKWAAARSRRPTAVGNKAAG
jgi:MOSC domain-containing protein YiiM